MTIKKFNVNSIVPGSITSAALSPDISTGGTASPKITAIAVADSSYNILDDTAVDTAGGYIVITGTGFVTGCQVIVGSLTASSVQFISSTTVRAQVPAQSAGTYIVYLVNADGGVAIRVNGLNYSGTPTWVTGSTLPTQPIDEVISIQLSATDAATYSLAAGSTLPTGLTLSSGGLLSGTVTGLSVDTVYNFSIIATDVELQDTPRAFSITITAGDAYWAYTSLLLQADSTATSFVNDASTNAFESSVNGDARPNNFNPYTPGYYSNYFDGNGDMLSLSPNDALDLTGDFTIEAWLNTVSSVSFIINRGGGTNIAWASYEIIISGTDILFAASSANNGYDIGGENATGKIGSFIPGQWTHIAVTRSGNVYRGFVNGVQGYTQTLSLTPYTASTRGLNIGASYQNTWGVAGNIYQMLIGYISNLRIIKGTAVYTENFTPPTAPLTAITGTSLLTCQGNRFIDSSANNFAITANGNTSISGFVPFVPNSNYANYGSGYFDGSGDYVSIASGMNAGTNDFSIETWIYPTAWTSEFGSIFSTRASNSTAGATDVWVLGVNNTGYPYVYSGAFQIQGSAGQIVLNRWSHLSVTRSGSTMRLFVNGTLVQTSTSLQNYTEAAAAIGANRNGSETFTGLISDLRLVIGTAVYTSSFTPPTLPITAITNTKLLTLQTNQSHDNIRIKDSSTNNLFVSRVGDNTTQQSSFTPYGSNWSNYFDGNTNRLTTATSSQFDLSLADITLECWVYMTAYPSVANRLITIGPNDFQSSLNFSITSSGVFSVGIPKGGQANVNSGANLIPLNTWTHLVFSLESNVGSIYINGSRVGQTSGWSITSTNSNYFYVGYDSTATVDGKFTGYISDVRLVVGTALYTGITITPPTAPLTAITNTKILTCNTNKFSDGSANNFAISRTGSMRVTKFSPYRIDTGYSTTEYSGSVFYNGGGLLISSNQAATFGTGDYTIEMWIYLTSNTQYYPQILNLSTADNNASIPLAIFFQDGPLGYRFGIKLGSDNVITGYTQTDFFNSWRHLAISRSGTSAKIFIDGTLITTLTDSVNYSSSYRIRSGYLVNESGTFYMAGYLSDVKITKGTALYSSNFSPPANTVTSTANTSLLLNFTGAGVTDNSMNHMITQVGSVRVSNSVKKYGTGSMYLPGSNSYFSIPNNPLFLFGAGNYTVEAWIYPQSFTGVPTIAGIWSVVSAGKQAWMLYIESGQPKFVIDPEDTVILTSNTALQLNTWQHVAVSKSGTAFRMFIDGVLVASATQSHTMSNASGNLEIGDVSDGGTHDFIGYIDDLRITRGYARYTANFTPPGKLASR